MKLTAELLTALGEAAARPPDQARAMPGGLYCSEDIYRLEQERIFRHGWLCAGRAAEIPEPGDYLTYSIGEQPVLVLRDRHGRIRAFSNVCLHRMMILAEGRGQCREIVCPYHAWTYDLDGQLLGAGQMRQSAGFDPRHFRLPELRCEIWQGWIYVTLDSALPSLAGALAPLAGVVDRYAMAEYVPVIQQDQVWQTNWKLLNENFMEGYHGPVVHRTTVGAGVAVADTEFPEPRGEAFTYSTFTKPETARYGRAHPDNRRLQGRWRYTAVLPTVFPCHSFSLSPDYLWYLSLRPRGPGEVAVRIGVSIAPENHAAETDLPGYIRTLEGFFDQVNAEDRMTVEGLYRGIQAPLATGGPLSWLERELHDFIRYLARRLVPEDGGAP